MLTCKQHNQQRGTILCDCVTLTFKVKCKGHSTNRHNSAYLVSGLAAEYLVFFTLFSDYLYVKLNILNIGPHIRIRNVLNANIFPFKQNYLHFCISNH